MTNVSPLAQSNLIRTEVGTLQSQIDKLQQQITSGQKSDKYGDLGALASIDINLRSRADQVDALKTSLSFLQIRTSVMDQSLNGVHDSVLNIRDLTLKNLSSDTGRQSLLQAAQAAVGQVTQQLNANVDGRFLFAGTATDVAPMTPDPAVLASVKAAINTALTAVPAPANIPAAIQGAVASVFATDTNFYAGGPAHPPSQIDDGLKIDTSITGNDPALKSMLQGLYTIAALDMPVDDPATLPQIDRTDFDATVLAASSQMGGGITGLENLIAKNGRNQSEIQDASNRHEATLTIVQTQINNVEQVDLADASSRIAQLRTQLQASFSLTAQLKDLSLVNFLTP
jgi:flagellar hook-associated protein 3 FlgL